LTDLPPRNGARVALTWSHQPLQSRQSHRTCRTPRPKVHPCQPRCCLAPHVRALGVYRPPSAAPRALLADTPPRFQPLPGSPARHGRSTALQKAHLKVLQTPRAACACPCPCLCSLLAEPPRRKRARAFRASRCVRRPLPRSARFSVKPRMTCSAKSSAQMGHASACLRACFYFAAFVHCQLERVPQECSASRPLFFCCGSCLSPSSPSMPQGDVCRSKV
jgi:hypothetical protein